MRKGGIAAFFQPSAKVQKLDITAVQAEATPQHVPSHGEPYSDCDETLQHESHDGSTDSDDDDNCDDVLGPSTEKQHDGIKQKSIPGPNDLSQTPNDGPMQPYLRNYPIRVIGNTKRCFNYKWYNMYPWLEYSES